MVVLPPTLPTMEITELLGLLKWTSYSKRSNLTENLNSADTCVWNETKSLKEARGGSRIWWLNEILAQNPKTEHLTWAVFPQVPQSLIWTRDSSSTADMLTPINTSDCGNSYRNPTKSHASGTGTSFLRFPEYVGTREHTCEWTLVTATTTPESDLLHTHHPSYLKSEMELLEDILLQKQSLIQVIHESVKVVELRSSSQVRFFNFLSGLVETTRTRKAGEAILFKGGTHTCANIKDEEQLRGVLSGPRRVLRLVGNVNSPSGNVRAGGVSGHTQRQRDELIYQIHQR